MTQLSLLGQASLGLQQQQLCARFVGIPLSARLQPTCCHCREAACSSMR